MLRLLLVALVLSAVPVHAAAPPLPTGATVVEPAISLTPADLRALIAAAKAAPTLAAPVAPAAVVAPEPAPAPSPTISGGAILNSILGLMPVWLPLVIGLVASLLGAKARGRLEAVSRYATLAYHLTQEAVALGVLPKSTASDKISLALRQFTDAMTASGYAPTPQEADAAKAIWTALSGQEKTAAAIAAKAQALIASPSPAVISDPSPALATR